MSGSMSQKDLIDDLKASLKDVAEGKFDPGDYDRILSNAALDMGRVRPRTLIGEITLVADQMTYAAPTDLRMPKFSIWGQKERSKGRFWETGFPRTLPTLSMVEVAGVNTLCLTPAPDQEAINILGSKYQYFYFAGHVVASDATKTTINSADRGLFMIRAQAEACKELAARQMNKPVMLRDGMGMTAKNGTPAALWKSLMEQFEKMA